MEQKMMYFADDGSAFETEDEALAHDQLCEMEDSINAFAAYHAEMTGHTPAYANKIADMLIAYEKSKTLGVPVVPKEVKDANAANAAARKKAREQAKAA